MSPFTLGSRLPRAATMVGIVLLAGMGAALACDCDGGYDSYGYHHDDYRPYRAYSCYGGGYDCGYEGYYNPYRYRSDHDGCGDGCHTRHYYDRDWDGDDDRD